MELILADGVQWVSRSESMIRLLGHRDALLVVVAAWCASVWSFEVFVPANEVFSTSPRSGPSCGTVRG